MMLWLQVVKARMLCFYAPLSCSQYLLSALLPDTDNAPNATMAVVGKAHTLCFHVPFSCSQPLLSALLLYALNSPYATMIMKPLTLYSHSLLSCSQLLHLLSVHCAYAHVLLSALCCHAIPTHCYIMYILHAFIHTTYIPHSYIPHTISPSLPLTAGPKSLHVRRFANLTNHTDT